MIQTNIPNDYGKAVRPQRAGCCFSGRRRFQAATGVALILGLMFGLAVPVSVRADDPSPLAAPSLRAADLFTLATLSKKFFESLPDPSRLNAEKIVAFEENPRFVYLAGHPIGGRWESPAEWAGKSLRRIVLLKPGTFVIDDRMQVPAAATTVRWRLRVRGKLEVDGRKFRVSGPEGELTGAALLPKDATFRIAGSTNADGNAAEQFVEVQCKADAPEARFLHVLQVRQPNDKSSGPRCRLVQNDDGWQLTVTAAAQTLKLRLPAGRDAAGTIAIATVEGRSVLDRRLLPSGIMPHGEEGVGLLRRWDTAYHDNRRPGWDTGRVAPELKKVVEKGTAGRGRAVVFGCGTGTNAIYLAGKGFEVTGIDVAPTALTRAQQKAREAGVNVRWVLADVLALPELGPFDLVFDRGCYHHVRQYNAAGYVESVRRLSRRGTRLLLLAGSANEPRPGGPPKIKEEEIRGDFSESFQFEWLREIRFDSVNPDTKGPLAWSVLLRRKETQ